MALLNLVNELTGTIVGLSPQLARTYINRALTDIYDERKWSFLITDGLVVCPTQITAGAVSITQFSNQVTLDAAASAAVASQIAAGAVPGITNLSIRFGATSPAAGQVYNILVADDTAPAAVVLTLNRVVAEATNPAIGYQCYRPYVIPPSSDFLGWQSWNDMQNAIALTNRNGRLTLTSAYFDARDPQRQAQGLAYFLGSYAGAFVSDPTTSPPTIEPVGTAAAGSNLYELWPHPTSGQQWYVRYHRRGVNGLVAMTDSQPVGISDALILAKALYAHVYPFVMANLGNFPNLKGTPAGTWQALLVTKRVEYRDLLLEAKRTDDEAALQTVWNRGHGLRDGYHDFKGVSAYPIDSNFLQSHLVRI